MDEDPSNEAYVLSLLEGYGADEAEAMDTEPAPNEGDWRDKYIAWMDRGELPSDRSEARRIARMAKSFALVNGELYKRVASGVLQRCVPIPQGRELLLDIHTGVCGHHAAPRTLVGNAFRQGFYWPTAVADSRGSCAPANLRRVLVLRPQVQPTCTRPADHPRHMALRCMGAGYRRAFAKSAQGLHPPTGCHR
jgi:hypothetical protein